MKSAEPDEKEEGKEVYKSCKFRTTLQAEVAESKYDELRRILGIHVLNIDNKDDIWIVKYVKIEDVTE